MKPVRCITHVSGLDPGINAAPGRIRFFPRGLSVAAPGVFVSRLFFNFLFDGLGGLVGARFGADAYRHLSVAENFAGAWCELGGQIGGGIFPPAPLPRWRLSRT